MKSKSNNLVLSAACGLDPNLIEFFLKSLRMYYSDNICFLVGKKDLETKKFLKLYNADFLEIDVHKFDVQIKRYEFYLKILKEKKYENILICDSRDIYFQSNPFDYPFKGSINFFLEDKKIKDCPYNSEWIIKSYGKKIHKSLSESIINCSGTTLGSYDGLKKYLSLMIQQSSKHKFKKRLKYLLTFRRDKGGRGVDQAYSNFIVHNKLIENSFTHQNSSGPFATVYYLNKIRFNKEFQLINILDKPYAVVHQYDKRWSEFEFNVTQIKKRLAIN